jgi:phosphoribosyl 1,2-cyclic phosphate phosphodiesterase
MQMILMGTGTSHGMPVIACHCKACMSADPKDTRYRCSAYITHRGKDGRFTRLVIDTGPEFRLQALKYGIEGLDAVLLTHSHADHLHGLDDLRVFSHTYPSDYMRVAGVSDRSLRSDKITCGLPVYTNPSAIIDIKNRFDYIFRKTLQGGGIPKLSLKDCSACTGENPLFIGGLRIIPVPLIHGNLSTTGFLISCLGKDDKLHSTAYLTDCSFISDESISLVTTYGGILDAVIIDGLRARPHPTHCNFDEALSYANRLAARQTWLIHICHDMCHEEIIQYVNNHIPFYPNLSAIIEAGGSVGPGYDGLVVSSGE